MDYDEPGDQLERWQRGRTGYPIVDAGMRQLRATGWMHNRVRMIVASFLVKDLHVEWQHGARHFMHWLVDGDLASNQHGWQWTAGCGTDAAPYFRVFNPITQGSKFDPDGSYVRRWVPELADADDPHEPVDPSRRPRRGASRGAGAGGRGYADDRAARPARFCGPAASGNGGWTAGALAGAGRPEGTDDRAAMADAPATTAARRRRSSTTERRRRAPPTARTVTAARRRVVDRDLDAGRAGRAREAAAAEATYAGPASPTRSRPASLRHGPRGGRRAADLPRPRRRRGRPDAGGGHVDAAPVARRGLAPVRRRTLHASLAVAWAALDCVGGWAGDLEERPMVLGRMTARVDALPEIGDDARRGRRRPGLRRAQDVHRRHPLRPRRSGGRRRRARLDRGRRCGHVQRGDDSTGCHGL